MADAAESLPHVDEHSIVVHADPRSTWAAAADVAEGAFAAPFAGRLARLLGCAEVEASGPRPLAAGAAFPGFHVEAAEPPRLLALRGRHRFSDYALIIRVEEAGDETLLRAETRAAFPGPHGRVYRALVIGSRGHVVAVRRLLGGMRRRAERQEPRSPEAGLCGSCVHQQLVPNTRGSTFSLCLRSRSEPEYPRYPRLPVLSCRGHQPRAAPAQR